MSTRKGLILAAPTAALIAAIGFAVLASDPGDWRPLSVLLILFALAVASDAMTVQLRSVHVSGAFFAVVLAMVLLGPAPAAVIGAMTTLSTAPFSRRPASVALHDALNWAVFPLVGGFPEFR